MKKRFQYNTYAMYLICSLNRAFCQIKCTTINYICTPIIASNQAPPAFS